MKKIICFLLAFFWLSFFFQMSAQYNFQIIVSNHEVIESMVLNTDSTIQSLAESKTLSAEISKYKIVEYKKAYPAFEDPRLQNIYLFKVTKPGLSEELLKEFPDKFLEYWVVDEPVLLYEPNDFAGDPYIPTQNDILLIRGKHAWDISKGSSSIKVGINDTYKKTVIP